METDRGYFLASIFSLQLFHRLISPDIFQRQASSIFVFFSFFSFFFSRGKQKFFFRLIENRSTARWILERLALFISRLVDGIEIFLWRPFCSRPLLIQDVHTRAATVSLKREFIPHWNLRRRDFDAIKRTSENAPLARQALLVFAIRLDLFTPFFLFLLFSRALEWYRESKWFLASKHAIGTCKFVEWNRTMGGYVSLSLYNSIIILSITFNFPSIITIRGLLINFQLIVGIK